MHPHDIAFYLTIEDPENVAAIDQAYCILAELHFNFDNQAIAAVFKCFRSYEAYQQGKREFDLLHIQLDPKSEGAEFFKQHGLNGELGKLSRVLRDHCLNHCHQLQQARSADPAADVDASRDHQENLNAVG